MNNYSSEKNYREEDHEMITKTSDIVPTLGGYGLYGGGTHVGSGFNAFQNLLIRNDVDRVKDNQVLLAGFADSREAARFGDLDNKIDRQTAFLDSKIDNFKTDFYKNELEKQRTEAILQGQEKQRIQSELNAFCCPKPTGCGGASNGNGGNSELLIAIDSIVANRINSYKD